MNRASDWLKQAERDLAVAESVAAAGYHEWAAFAAQQAAEKAAKALVQAVHGASRGHTITTILGQLRGPIAVPGEVLDRARELDQVYVTARYPNGFATGAPGDYFTESTSRRLIDHARAILEFCRGAIP